MFGRKIYIMCVCVCVWGGGGGGWQGEREAGRGCGGIDMKKGLIRICGQQRTSFVYSDQDFHCQFTLRKHAYSNILKLLPPKNGNFSDKKSDIFQISAQNIDCGYSLEPPRRGGSNRLVEAVLTSTHNLCF